MNKFYIVPIRIIFLCFIANIVYAADNQTILPLDFNTGRLVNGLPSTTVTIQDKKIPLILDIGDSTAYVSLTPYALKGIKVEYTGNKVCRTSFSGKQCDKEFIVPKLTIGDFELFNIPGVEIEELWGGNKDGFVETEASRSGVIGLALLKKFNVLLDYSKKIAILAKNNQLPIEANYDVQNWIKVPFSLEHGNITTTAKIRDKKVELVWDTGAVPSSINFKTISAITHKCTDIYNYSNDPKCEYTLLDNIEIGNNLIPKVWFLDTGAIQGAESFPFAGLIGSNFFQENLVYINFLTKQLHIKPIAEKLIK